VNIFNIKFWVMRPITDDKSFLHRCEKY